MMDTAKLLTETYEEGEADESATLKAMSVVLLGRIFRAVSAWIPANTIWAILQQLPISKDLLTTLIKKSRPRLVTPFRRQRAGFHFNLGSG